MKAIALCLLMAALGDAGAFAQGASPQDSLSAPGTRVRVKLSSTTTVNTMIEQVDPTMAGEPWSMTGDGAAVKRDAKVVLVVPRVGSRLTGTIVRLNDRALAMIPDRREIIVTIPRAAIERLERSRGEGWGRAGHAGVGALLGAGIGALIGFAAADDCSSGQLCLTGASVAGGALLIGGIGALVGLALPAERWVPVSAAAPMAVAGGLAHPFDRVPASGRRSVRVGIRPAWRASNTRPEGTPFAPRLRLGFGAEVVVRWSRVTGSE